MSKPPPEPSPRPDEEEIVIECDLPDAPEKVWRVVTVPELLAAWLLETDGLPGAHGAQRETQESTLEPLSMEPQHQVRYRWSEQHHIGAGERRLESELSFELTPAAGGGTHLRIVHSTFRMSHVIRMCAAAAARPQPAGPVRRVPFLHSGLKWAA